MLQDVQQKLIFDLKAEHTHKILEIQRNHDIELCALNNNIAAVTLLANNKMNQNHDLLEALEINQNLKEEIARIKDFCFLR